MDSLEIIQRKSLRIVLRKDYYCSGSELYSIKILPVSSLCQLASAVLTFKFTHNLAKLNFSIEYVHNVHRYPTSNRNDIVIPRTQTQLGAMDFFIRAFSLFNNLPVSIKNQISIGRFKTRLREYIYDGVVMRYMN